MPNNSLPADIHSLEFILDLLRKLEPQLDEEALNYWFSVLLIIQSRGKFQMLKTIGRFLTQPHLHSRLKEPVKCMITIALKDAQEEIDLYRAEQLELTEKQRKYLYKMARGTHTPGHLKQRAQIILLYFDDGLNISQVARECGCVRDTVQKWVVRWKAGAPDVNMIEKDQPHKLKSAIESVLEDAYRYGSPGKFTAEQICQIVNLALHKEPEELGLPLNAWTVKDLAEQAVELGIVDYISSSRVHSILQEFDLKPHRHEMWLNPKIEDVDAYNRQVKLICDLYQRANELEEMGIHLICTDEMTGIQALQHQHPKQAAEIGKPERIEANYKRKGTIGIIASRFVVNGKVKTLVQNSRTEKDFEKHIREVIAQDDTKNYIFVVDQLNIHKSEALVLLSAEYSGIDPSTLGEKGKSGVLKSMETRAEFLSDPQRKLRFVYVPKHCSWLNQIEIWFSIIKRRILNRRANYNSVEELKEKIIRFIEHYNENLAKPFNWTYGGKVLKENGAEVI